MSSANLKKLVAEKNFIKNITYILSISLYHRNINTLIVHTSYTIAHTDCIMTMTQYITLLYVLTSSLLSTSAPFDSKSFTVCKWPPSDALYKGVLSHYNNYNQ